MGIWNWVKGKEEEAQKIQPVRSIWFESLEPRLLLSADLSEPVSLLPDAPLGADAVCVDLNQQGADSSVRTLPSSAPVVGTDQVQAVGQAVDVSGLRMLPDAFRVSVDAMAEQSELSAGSGSPPPTGQRPYGAEWLDNSEFMIGDVWVTVVLMESDGSIHAETEDWSLAEISTVKQEVQEGLTWWEDTFHSAPAVTPREDLRFLIDFTYCDNPVATGYEPIGLPQYAEELWINDFLDQVGYHGPFGYSFDLARWNDAQRLAHQTHWAYTVFIVDSSNDADGCFLPNTPGADPYFAYACLGGPFLVMTSDNRNWGLPKMGQVLAHETGHIFYALDEYPDTDSWWESSGYYCTQNLNAHDGNPSPGNRVDSIMAEVTLQNAAYANHTSSPSSLKMLGWQDGDADGVFDVNDLSLWLTGDDSYDPGTGLWQFSGSSTVRRLDNQNPNGLGNDITTNAVDLIRYRIDGGSWTDGNRYGGYVESSINQSVLIPSSGVHQIEVATFVEESGVASPILTFSQDFFFTGPEIDVRGGISRDISIPCHDVTPNTTDGTDFGCVAQGGAATSRTFLVYNDGRQNLTLGAVNPPTGFTVTEPLAGSLAPGASDTFTVQLDTTVTGTKTGDIMFANNDADENPFSFRITGVVGVPEVTVLGNGITIADGDTAPGTADGTDFGKVAGGGTAVSRTFTVRNTGTGPLTLGPVSAPTGFTVTRQLPDSLAPGASDTFTVQLDTSPSGTKTGDITFANSDPNENPYNFRVTGIVGAEITVLGNGVSITDGDTTPSSTDGTNFGKVAVGSTPVSRTFTVRNDGGGPLMLGAVGTPLGFVVTEPLWLTLQAGESDTFTVQMDTTEAGTKSGEISFWNTDPNENPFNFRISGIVGPEITVLGNGISIADGDTTPSTADGTDFGKVALHGTPVYRAFTVRNDGGGPLTLGAVNAPTGFTVIEELSASLAPGLSDTFVVQLDTAVAGTKTWDIIFTTNDPDENPFNFRVTGIVGPEITVLGKGISISDGDATPSTTDDTDFGSVPLGFAPISHTFTVRNDGGGTLTLGAVGAPSGFTVTEPLAASLVPGASDTFTVRLNTGAVGTKMGDVSFTSDDPNENPFNFRITGTVVGTPEITVLGNGVSIADGDITPSTTDGTRFGSVAQGGMPISRTFTVRNDGTDTLTLGTVTVPTGFSVTEGLVASLAPGASDMFTVQLDTATAGIKVGTLYFTCNDADEGPNFAFRITGTVTLTGNPEITVLGNGVSIVDGDTTPSATDGTSFGSVPQGGTPISHTFTVRNDGTGTLTLGTVMVPTGFTVTEGLVASLATGASDTFTVRLDTTTTGTKVGTLYFACNDASEGPNFSFRITGAVTTAGNPEITVLGNGVSIADGDTTPSTTDGTDFGSVPQGGTPISRTFTVRNDGAATLTLGTVAGSADFTLTEGLSASLAAGASDNFTVQLNTAVTGTKTWDISFATNDSDENPFSFRITGTVTPAGNPEITVLGNAISIADGDITPTRTDGTDFGSVAQGGPPISRTFTVRNDGTGTLTLGAVILPTGFTLTEGLVGSLAAGASDTFAVRLDTATTGTKVGTLYFACNDASEGPNFSFRITGTVVTAGNPEITVLGNGVSITDGDTTPSATDGTSFGSVAQGGAPISHTFTVRNDGTGTLTLGAVTVPTGFTLTEGLVGSLAAGALDTFTVRLDTAVAGTKVGTLYFACNDASEGPNFSFRITGTVVA